MEDLLLANGTIIDGAGSPPRSGDVLIRGDRIAEVGRFEPPADARRMDCSGLSVAPGFIDGHSHSDLQVLEGRRDKLRQGVTAEVVGNCGFSPYPAPADAAPLREFANGIFCGDDSWGWPSVHDYLHEAASSPTAHVASLVGHGSLRIAAAGDKQGSLSIKERDVMEGLLTDALTAGATGLSTGLMYAPGSSAPFEELERLCRIVARHGKIYTTHMRSYFSGVLGATEEQLELARRAGSRLQISHLQVVGAANWPIQARVIERIELARDEGIDVAFDCYPYVAGSTVLTQVLPQSALDGGNEKMLARLRDPAQRERISGEVEATFEWRWKDIYISAVSTEPNADAVGRNLEELAAERAVAPVQAMIDLLMEEAGKVNMLCFNQSEDNLRQTLTHPLSMIISDGFYVKGRPHPRLHGTFPLWLGSMVRERAWLSIEDAVHKITDYPARRFNIERRGRLEPGYFADVTVFDAPTVNSPATYEEPEQAPVGICYVIRNGKLEEQTDGC
jgi:N-acyl-D-aspartate/D-glutamate deacylase